MCSTFALLPPPRVSYDSATYPAAASFCCRGTMCGEFRLPPPPWINTTTGQPVLGAVALG